MGGVGMRNKMRTHYKTILKINTIRIKSRIVTLIVSLLFLIMLQKYQYDT
jgi:hypothetical protein